MTLNLTIPTMTHTDFSPRITVIGVGGGGTNAVDLAGGKIDLQRPTVGFHAGEADKVVKECVRRVGRMNVNAPVLAQLGLGFVLQNLLPCVETAGNVNTAIRFPCDAG